MTRPRSARIWRITAKASLCFGFLWASAGGALAEPGAQAGEAGALLTAAFSSLRAEGATSTVLLSESDIGHYTRALEAQAKADWAKADEALAKVSDPRLVGHVLAQRYLEAPGYRASFDTLRAWLARYGDLPQAGRIHALALRRQPRGESNPHQPSEFRDIRVGLPAAASMASTDSPAWRAGLTAWQAHDYAQALVNFQQVSRSRDVSPWEKAAGSYWAARCLARLGRPAEVTAWLVRAAAHGRTFYGLVAQQQLGLESELRWNVPPLSPTHLKTLSALPGGNRALGLIQLGQRTLAEAELRRLQNGAPAPVQEALVALSIAAGLPYLALRVGNAVAAPDGTLYDAALYPVPQWEPEGGFKVDRALLFALMRQESRFEPNVRSRAGAVGLMQLMPTTAGFLAGRSFEEEATQADLEDPETNMTLGQKYIQHLLAQPGVEGNLLYLLASYNGGPTQAARWRRAMGEINDPLLFLETIPASETRDFAERVLANYWIYQTQMGRDLTSLESLVSGSWPLYADAGEDTGVRVIATAGQTGSSTSSLPAGTPRDQEKQADAPLLAPGSSSPSPVAAPLPTP